MSQSIFFLAYHKTSLDVSFNFYVAYNRVNITNATFDRQITITNTDNEIAFNALETMDQANEFILLDLECNDCFDILMNIDIQKLQNYYWIILNTNGMEQVYIQSNPILYLFHTNAAFIINFQLNIDNRFWSTVRNLNVSLNSELFYIQKEKSENVFKIQQFYRIDMAMPMIVENYGRISNDTFIANNLFIPITSRRRSNLFGMHFKASMVITDNDTMNHLTDYR